MKRETRFSALLNKQRDSRLRVRRASGDRNPTKRDCHGIRGNASQSTTEGKEQKSLHAFAGILKGFDETRNEVQRPTKKEILDSWWSLSSSRRRGREWHSHLSCRSENGTPGKRGVQHQLLPVIDDDDATETANIFLDSGVISIIFRSMIK